MRALALFSVLIVSVACDESSGNGGSGGQGGAGAQGGAAGSAGSGAGTAGTSGGSAGSAGTAGGGGGASGSAGSAGAAGSAGGAGAAGSGGSGGGTLGFQCPAGPFDAPVPADVHPEPVAGVPIADGYGAGWSNVEGPVWIGDSLYVSHIQGGQNPPSRILKITDTTVTEFLDPAGTNGLAVSNAGELYGARHSDGSIAKIDLTTPTNSTPIVSMYGEPAARFKSPNDLAIRSDGNIYFSDPDYQAPASGTTDDTRVYRIEPGTNALSVVDDSIQNPNGVTLSLDENSLFVASTEGAGVRKYPVNADGSTGAGAQVSPINGDGMAVDCAGNLYVASGSEVVILNVSGASATEVDRITFEAPNPLPGGSSVTNVAFGGADRKTLYITYLGNTPGLSKITLNVPGLPY